MSDQNVPPGQPEFLVPQPDTLPVQPNIFQQHVDDTRTYPPQSARDAAQYAAFQQAARNEAISRKARDRAVYTRQQKGHSLTLHILLGAFVLWIPAIYYTVSPNHYWHI